MTFRKRFGYGVILAAQLVWLSFAALLTLSLFFTVVGLPLGAVASWGVYASLRLLRSAEEPQAGQERALVRLVAGQLVVLAVVICALTALAGLGPPANQLSLVLALVGFGLLALAWFIVATGR